MAIVIEEIRKSERSAELVQNLLVIWEKSVRATHTFLSEEEILKINEYVPGAICNVEMLLVLRKNDEISRPLGFMRIENRKIEMLFFFARRTRKRFRQNACSIWNRKFFCGRSYRERAESESKLAEFLD